MKFPPVFRHSLAAAIVLLTTVSAAHSGGDDYDAMNDTEGQGPAYFGFVKDTRGAPVAGAEVRLAAKGHEPLVLKTNVLGLYRSHFKKDVPPGDVEMSCGKQGYRQTEALHRAAPGTRAMNVEINCTLQRQ